MSAVDVATKLVDDAAGRLLLGNMTSLNVVTETEQRYKSLQTRLRQSDSVDEVSSASSLPPLLPPSSRHHLSYDDCLADKR